MAEVGALEAMIRLFTLLDRVARGDEIVITRRGKPVARLVPARAEKAEHGAEVIAELRRLRERTRLDGLSWRALRDEGRRNSPAS